MRNSRWPLATSHDRWLGEVGRASAADWVRTATGECPASVPVTRPREPNVMPQVESQKPAIAGFLELIDGAEMSGLDDYRMHT